MARIISFLCVLLTGCANRAIPPESLAGQLDSQSRPLIFDVRSAREYQSGHIPGAVNIPFWNVAGKMTQALKQACQEKPVVVTCEHGPRAYIAAAGLKSLGCKNIQLLKGHMLGWRAKGLPLEKNGGK